MKQVYIIICVLCAAMIMTGCRHASQMNLLVEAEAFLPAEPDSADVRLQMVDVEQLRDEEESAYYALLRTMTDAMQGAECPNDTLVRKAYTFFSLQSDNGATSNHSMLKHYGQSALYMGDWYAANDSIKASEDCYRQAIKASEKCEDWHTCYIAYSCLADQVHWASPKEGLRLVEKAIDVYAKCKDNCRNLISLYEYAANYAVQIVYEDASDDYQQPLNYGYKAYHLAKDSCFDDYYVQTNLLLAEIYWAKGDYQEALNYVRDIHIEEMESESSLTTNMKIAQYYLSSDSILKAKELYQAPKVIPDKTLTYLYARGLAEVAAHELVKDTILFYMDSAFTASEAMFLDALKVKDDYYHDNLEKEKANERLVYQDKLKTWIFGGAIGIILISSLLIGRVLILRIRMHREHRRNSIMQRKYDLEKSIEDKRRTALEMQLLQDRQQALADSHQKKTAAIKHLQRYIIDRTDATMKLKDGVTHVRMSAKEWADVEQLLDEIGDGRISKIRARFKDLSIDDIRLCVMVSIGMSNPAIGNVYGITPSAVQHRKLTLKKKGFGIDNPNVTLENFIESL